MGWCVTAVGFVAGDFRAKKGKEDRLLQHKHLLHGLLEMDSKGKVDLKKI